VPTLHVYSERARLLYLVAVMDWASPGGARLAAVEQMDVSFCASALEEALARFGRREHRPGQQVHQRRLHRLLAAAGIHISMDGCGRWMDNAFIERLWRSLKHEDIYLKGYANGPRGAYRHRRLVRFLQQPPPASGLGSRTPMAAWSEGMAVDSSIRLWT
jgi:putative transposase